MYGKELAGLLRMVRANRPLVHHITNYVTVNDCANVTLSVGASPVMADSRDEVEDMVAMAGALVLNIGTLNSFQIESMLLAGAKAEELGIPIILDPVGAGATPYRTDTARMLLSSIPISVVKGNAGEISVLAGTGGSVRGVDSMSAGGDPIDVASRSHRTLV